MRTLIQVYDYGRNVGGINPIICGVSNLLCKDYKVIVCTADEDFDGFDPLIETHTLSNVCSKEKSDFKRAMACIWNPRAYKNFKKLLSKHDNKSTVIHFHGWGMGLSVSVIYAAKKMNFKCLYTAHDYSLFCPNGVYYDFSKNLDCTLKPMSNSCIASPCDKKGRAVKFQRIIRKKIEQNFISIKSDFEKIICVSNQVSKLMKNFGIYKNKIVTLRNPYGSILEEDYNVDLDIQKNKYVFIGRLTVEKGVEDFCKVINELSLKGKIIGDGPLRRKIEKKYPDIEVVGWVKPGEMSKYLEDAKCVVLCSRWREPSALVVEDSISRNIPVIVPTETGAEEKIYDKRSKVFKKNCIISLKKVILEFDRDQIPIFEVKESIKKIESYEKYSHSLTKIYRNILNA